MQAERNLQRVGFVLSMVDINPATLPSKIKETVYLYKITNLINGKICIGQTDDLRRRFHQYRTDFRRKLSSRAIHKAFLKYGLDNFSFEYIATCSNKEDGDATEIELIKQDRSHVSYGTGYNVEWGGKCALKSEETRKKISISLKKFYQENESSQKGKKHTEQAKMNISIASMGKAGTNTGKTFDDGWCLKISQSLVGKERKSERRFSEEVEQEICRFYVEDNMSTGKLGEKFDCWKSLITTILERNNINIRPTKKLFNDEVEKEICQLYKNGIIVAELSRMFKSSKGAISNVLDRNKIQRKRPYKLKKDKNCKLFTIDQEKEICSLYVNDKISKRQLAKRFSCSNPTIDRILKVNNIEKNITVLARDKFTSDQKKEICNLYKSGTVSLADLSRRFDCRRSVIKEILWIYDIKL